MALRCEHWDDFPEGTVFFVRQIPEGPDQGLWGIEAQHPVDGQVWVGLGSPLKVVAALNPEMAQRDLKKLCKSTAMREAAEIRGEDARAPGLPDPRSFPTVRWDEVPESARLKEREFHNHIWGIVAEMPEGGYIVILDQFFKNADYHTYSATREEAQRAIFFLEAFQTPPDPQPQIEERLRDVTSSPIFSGSDEREHFGAILAAINEVAEKDRKIVADLEREWLRRLELGNRQSCLCGQCRHEIRYKLAKITSWYEESMGYVPEELRLDSLRLLDILDK